jgi:hypothetical protein
VLLEPLPGSLPVIRAHGEVQAVASKPRTINEILHNARKAMELEDAYVAWLEGKPVPQLRHPRRTLRMWLRGQWPPPPAMPEPMTEVVPVWRAGY